MRQKLRGSIVVESALVFPIFLLAISHQIYWIDFIDVERKLFIEVIEKARKLAGESFIDDNCSGELIEVKKGVLLRGNYFSKIAKARPFIGRYYDNSILDWEDTKLVFITKNGEVYHKSIVCSHLRPSLKLVSKKEVKEKRNQKGEKYYKCEFCGKKNEATLYITAFGNRYHTDKKCKGIKRTIRITNLRMAKGMGLRRCKKCGGYDD